MYSGVDLNCIREELIPSKYYHKTIHSLRNSSRQKMGISYKLPRAYIFKDKVCIHKTFVLVKDISNDIILGVPFFP